MRTTVPDNGTSHPSPGSGDDIRFRDEEAAVRHAENVLWHNTPTCPHCGSKQLALRADGKSRRCNACRRDSTVLGATPFARSHIPLHVWLRAVYLFTQSEKTVSSSRLGRELGIRQASAWSMLQRLQAADGGVIARLAEGLGKTAPNPAARKTSHKDASMALTRQDLAGKIRDGIQTGSLCIGNKLPPEREIAARFGTGRGLVREALIVLETLGFIEVRGKEGVFVRTLSEEECNRSLDVYSGWPAEMLPHTFQVRLVLESEAAGLAAMHRTEADVQRMAFCIDGFLRVCREKPDDWNIQGGTLNDLFHKLVIEAAHNPVLMRIHEGLLSIIKKAYSTFGTESMITPLDQWEERVVKSHRVIMEAIKAKDETAARNIMRNHLEITFTKLDAFYRERIEGVLRTIAG